MKLLRTLSRKSGTTTASGRSPPKPKRRPNKARNDEQDDESSSSGSEDSSDGESSDNESSEEESEMVDINVKEDAADSSNSESSSDDDDDEEDDAEEEEDDNEDEDDDDEEDEDSSSSSSSSSSDDEDQENQAPRRRAAKPVKPPRASLFQRNKKKKANPNAQKAATKLTRPSLLRRNSSSNGKQNKNSGGLFSNNPLARMRSSRSQRSGAATPISSMMEPDENITQAVDRFGRDLEAMGYDLDNTNDFLSKDEDDDAVMASRRRDEERYTAEPSNSLHHHRSYSPSHRSKSSGYDRSRSPSQRSKSSSGYDRSRSPSHRYKSVVYDQSKSPGHRSKSPGRRSKSPSYRSESPIQFMANKNRKHKKKQKRKLVEDPQLEVKISEDGLGEIEATMSTMTNTSDKLKAPSLVTSYTGYADHEDPIPECDGEDDPTLEYADEEDDPLDEETYIPQDGSQLVVTASGIHKFSKQGRNIGRYAVATTPAMSTTESNVIHPPHGAKTNVRVEPNYKEPTWRKMLSDLGGKSQRNKKYGPSPDDGNEVSVDNDENEIVAPAVDKSASGRKDSINLNATESLLPETPYRKTASKHRKHFGITAAGDEVPKTIDVEEDGASLASSLAPRRKISAESNRRFGKPMVLNGNGPRIRNFMEQEHTFSLDAETMKDDDLPSITVKHHCHRGAPPRRVLELPTPREFEEETPTALAPLIIQSTRNYASQSPGHVLVSEGIKDESNSVEQDENVLPHEAGDEVDDDIVMELPTEPFKNRQQESMNDEVTSSAASSRGRQRSRRSWFRPRFGRKKTTNAKPEGNGAMVDNNVASPKRSASKSPIRTQPITVKSPRTTSLKSPLAPHVPSLGDRTSRSPGIRKDARENYVQHQEDKVELPKRAASQVNCNRGVGNSAVIHSQWKVKDNMRNAGALFQEQDNGGTNDDDNCGKFSQSQAKTQFDQIEVEINEDPAQPQFKRNGSRPFFPQIFKRKNENMEDDRFKISVEPAPCDKQNGNADAVASPSNVTQYTNPNIVTHVIRNMSKKAEDENSLIQAVDQMAVNDTMNNNIQDEPPVTYVSLNSEDPLEKISLLDGFGKRPTGGGGQGNVRTNGGNPPISRIHPYHQPPKNQVHEEPILAQNLSDIFGLWFQGKKEKTTISQPLCGSRVPDTTGFDLCGAMTINNPDNTGADDTTIFNSVVGSPLNNRSMRVLGVSSFKNNKTRSTRSARDDFHNDVSPRSEEESVHVSLAKPLPPKVKQSSISDKNDDPSTQPEIQTKQPRSSLLTKFKRVTGGKKKDEKKAERKPITKEDEAEKLGHRSKARLDLLQKKRGIKTSTQVLPAIEKADSTNYDASTLTSKSNNGSLTGDRKYNTKDENKDGVGHVLSMFSDGDETYGTLGNTWAEIADASLVVERAINRIDSFKSDDSRGSSRKIESLLSLNSNGSLDDDVEEALGVLRKHAKRLGVRESDLLLAVKSDDEVQDDAFLGNVLSKDDASASLKSLTFGEELIEAFSMYLKTPKPK